LAPRNDKESVIASIWREVLELSFVPVDVDFFSLGGTSIRALQVQRRIIDSFHLDLPLNALYEHPTVEGLVSQLGNPDDPEAPFVSILAKGANPVPWFGLMGIQLFEDIARHMSGSYSMLGIHVPARYRPGVDAFPTVQELAQKYVNVIRQHQPHGPYYLMGLCHGGIVAFEAAAQLEKAGETVGIVGLLDAELPQARITNPVIRIRYAFRDIVRNPGATIAKVSKKAANLFRMPKQATRSGLPVERVTYIDIPQDGPEIDADLLEYERFGRTVDCNIIAFRATDSSIAPWLEVSKDLGWTGRAKDLQCFDIPSSHLGIVRSPHATEIARLLSDARRQLEIQHP
jgi:thioesterase domain-containing protein